MISKNTFDKIFEKAKGCKYSSMNYISFDDCENAEILHDCDDLILIQDKSKTPAMLYFATNDFEALVKIIANIPGKLRLHFVPREFAPQLGEIGFIEWAEFVDFWNKDIAKTASCIDSKKEAEYADKDECEAIAAVSKRCELQSRGFEGVSPEYVSEWLDDGKVIVFRKSSQIVGFCSVSVYNEGTATLWIRSLAVDPAYQGQGIGRNLVEQAIKYGVQNGAIKGFLAADLLNDNAIGLYNKFGLHAKVSESELQMVKE